MKEDSPFEASALVCEEVAKELELAAKHMLITAEHFRSQEVPRASAHTLATLGHVEKAKALLAEIAIKHSEKAQL